MEREHLVIRRAVDHAWTVTTSAVVGSSAGHVIESERVAPGTTATAHGIDDSIDRQVANAVVVVSREARVFAVVTAGSARIFTENHRVGQAVCHVANSPPAFVPLDKGNGSRLAVQSLLSGPIVRRAKALNHEIVGAW